MRKTGHAPESSAERRADLAGLVDVLTELDKMARWGSDRRHNVGLTVRQRTMLSMAALRSSIYLFISCGLGVASMYLAWRLFGIRGSMVMFFAVMLPAVTTVAWVAVRMSHGEGAVWCQAARRVCLGFFEGATIFVFMNGLLLAIGVLVRRWCMAVWRSIIELLGWALEDGISNNLEWDIVNRLWRAIEIVLNGYGAIVTLLLVVLIVVVLLPCSVYGYIAFKEKHVGKKVEAFFS